MPARPAPRALLPFEPAPLEAQLAGLLRTTGAWAARVVDGTRPTVLAEAGTAAGDDVAALVQLARVAGVLAAASGEDLDDLVLAGGRTVHVLRMHEQPGVLLHVRLDRDRGDVAAARRALGAPSLLRAVRVVLAEVAAEAPQERATGSALPALPVQRGATSPLPGPPAPAREPLPELPVPRHPAEPGAGSAQRQPALVTLTDLHQPVRTGALAVLALPPVPAPVEPSNPEPADPEAPIGPVSLFDAGTTAADSPEGLVTGPLPLTLLPVRTELPAPTELPTQSELPRRRSSSPRLPERVLAPAPPQAVLQETPVLQQAWAHDVGTLRRLIEGLRKLA